MTETASTPGEVLPYGIVELLDEALSRLRLATPRGRVEVTYKDGRVVELRRHEVFHRSELARLDEPPLLEEAVERGAEVDR